MQTNVGQAVTKLTSGRYENIAVASRVATLLPEIGGEMAKMLGGWTKQLRVTFGRPAGATGELDRVSLAVRGKLVSNVTLAP